MWLFRECWIIFIRFSFFTNFKAHTFNITIGPTVTIKAITEESKKSNILDPHLGLHTDIKRFCLFSDC